MKFRFTQLSLFIITSTASIGAFFPINIFKPYDINLMPERWQGKCFQITGFYERGFNFHGFAPDENEESRDFTRRVNVLQLYQDNQNALAMLKGFPAESEIALFGQQFHRDGDNGVRGHLLPRGRFEVPYNFILSARYYFPYNINLQVHVPFMAMELRDVRFEDLTQDTRAEDRRIRELLTGRLVDVAQRLGGLDVGGWRRSGLGDIVVMSQWLEDFPQYKPLLKNVRLNARLGLSLPTGLKQDEDRLLAIPFGNDGSLGLLFGGGLDLRFGSSLRLGGDILLMHLFGSTRDRRIKTHIHQTDLLFLAKAPTFKEFGWTQQFNLYAQAWRFYRGLSFKVDYEYVKHLEDKLWLLNNNFNAQIANTAESLQESTMHGLILNLNYDFYCDQPNALIGPSIALFGKVGFNGKRAILGNTVGIQLSLSF